METDSYNQIYNTTINVLKQGSDNSKFAGLLLAQKLLPHASESDVNQIFQCLGISYLERTLLPLEEAIKKAHLYKNNLPANAQQHVKLQNSKYQAISNKHLQNIDNQISGRLKGPLQDRVGGQVSQDPNLKNSNINGAQKSYYNSSHSISRISPPNNSPKIQLKDYEDKQQEQSQYHQRVGIQNQKNGYEQIKMQAQYACLTLSVLNTFCRSKSIAFQPFVLAKLPLLLQIIQCQGAFGLLQLELKDDIKEDNTQSIVNCLEIMGQVFSYQSNSAATVTFIKNKGYEVLLKQIQNDEVATQLKHLMLLTLYHITIQNFSYLHQSHTAEVCIFMQQMVSVLPYFTKFMAQNVNKNQQIGLRTNNHQIQSHPQDAQSQSMIEQQLLDPTTQLSPTNDIDPLQDKIENQAMASAQDTSRIKQLTSQNGEEAGNTQRQQANLDDISHITGHVQKLSINNSYSKDPAELQIFILVILSQIVENVTYYTQSNNKLLTSMRQFFARKPERGVALYYATLASFTILLSSRQTGSLRQTSLKVVGFVMQILNMDLFTGTDQAFDENYCGGINLGQLLDFLNISYNGDASQQSSLLLFNFRLKLAQNLYIENALLLLDTANPFVNVQIQQDDLLERFTLRASTQNQQQENSNNLQQQQHQQYQNKQQQQQMSTQTSKDIYMQDNYKEGTQETRDTLSGQLQVYKNFQHDQNQAIPQDQASSESRNTDSSIYIYKTEEEKAVTNSRETSSQTSLEQEYKNTVGSRACVNLPVCFQITESLLEILELYEEKYEDGCDSYAAEWEENNIMEIFKTLQKCQESTMRFLEEISEQDTWAKVLDFDQKFSSLAGHSRGNLSLLPVGAIRIVSRYYGNVQANFSSQIIQCLIKNIQNIKLQNNNMITLVKDFLEPIIDSQLDDSSIKGTSIYQDLLELVKILNE